MTLVDREPMLLEDTGDSSCPATSANEIRRPSSESQAYVVFVRRFAAIGIHDIEMIPDSCRLVEIIIGNDGIAGIMKSGFSLRVIDGMAHHDGEKPTDVDRLRTETGDFFI
jgi:hypothetical protein